MRRILDEPDNKHVIRKLVLASVAMLVLPLTVFLAFRSVAGDLLGIASVGGRNLWGGIAAAVCANVILALYVWMAFTEKSPPSSSSDRKTD